MAAKKKSKKNTEDAAGAAGTPAPTPAPRVDGGDDPLETEWSKYRARTDEAARATAAQKREEQEKKAASQARQEEMDKAGELVIDTDKARRRAKTVKPGEEQTTAQTVRVITKTSRKKVNRIANPMSDLTARELARLTPEEKALRATAARSRVTQISREAGMNVPQVQNILGRAQRKAERRKTAVNRATGVSRTSSTPLTASEQDSLVDDMTGLPKRASGQSPTAFIREPITSVAGQKVSEAEGLARMLESENRRAAVLFGGTGPEKATPEADLSQKIGEVTESTDLRDPNNVAESAREGTQGTTTQGLEREVLSRRYRTQKGLERMVTGTVIGRPKRWRRIGAIKTQTLGEMSSGDIQNDPDMAEALRMYGQTTKDVDTSEAVGGLRTESPEGTKFDVKSFTPEQWTQVEALRKQVRNQRMQQASSRRGFPSDAETAANMRARWEESNAAAEAARKAAAARAAFERTPAGRAEAERGQAIRSARIQESIQRQNAIREQAAQSIQAYKQEKFPNMLPATSSLTPEQHAVRQAAAQTARQELADWSATEAGTKFFGGNAPSAADITAGRHDDLLAFKSHIQGRMSQAVGDITRASVPDASSRVAGGIGPSSGLVRVPRMNQAGTAPLRGYRAGKFVELSDMVPIEQTEQVQVPRMNQAGTTQIQQMDESGQLRPVFETVRRRRSDSLGAGAQAGR